MNLRRNALALLACLCLLPLTCGCVRSYKEVADGQAGGGAVDQAQGSEGGDASKGDKPEDKPADKPEDKPADKPEDKPADDSNIKYPPGKPGDPYDAPPLEELEKEVEWQPSLVVDSFERLRAWKLENDKPLAKPADVLSMKNDSAAANQKILNALSQLPPEDGKGVNFDDALNHSLIMDLRALNPILTSSVAESDYHKFTAVDLFSFDWKMIPYADGDFVKEWYTSKDRMFDKVILRDDITWSDGQPITAHDVVFSYQTILNPDVPVPAVRQGTDEIRWVEAYDDRTLVYFHPKPSAVAVWNLNFYVIPRHIYEESLKEDLTLQTSPEHQALEIAPVTGGPYKVVKRTRGQGLVLQRRDEWSHVNGKQVRWRPFFKEIRYRVLADSNTRLLALKTGEIDNAELDAEEWRTKTNDDDFYRSNTKVSGKSWTYFYIGWNLKTPYFSDKRVRQAMALTMNHDEMIDDLCYGVFQKSTGMFHPDSWMYPHNSEKPMDRFNKQNLDAAEDILDEVGWVDSDNDGIRDKVVDGKKIPFEFSLLVKNAPDRIAICNLFREGLESIGIKCNVRPMESAAHQNEVFEKKFQATMQGWGSGADPYTNENIFGTGADRNYGSYSNPEVDKLFEKGMAVYDRESRGKIYAKIHELVYEDQPYMFLYSRSAFYGFNKRLRGFNFSPRGPYHYSPGMQSIWAVQK